jgi:hypothetical protein
LLQSNVNDDTEQASNESQTDKNLHSRFHLDCPLALNLCHDATSKNDTIRGQILALDSRQLWQWICHGYLAGTCAFGVNDVGCLKKNWPSNAA